MGEGLTIGIKPNGSLIAWGSYNVTPPTGSFKSVSTGRNCAIAIDGNGSLVPFGANEYGRLNVPTGAFRSVSAADATWHAAGLRADGTIACWGFNNYGQANAPTEPLAQSQRVVMKFGAASLSQSVPMARSRRGATTRGASEMCP
jgi:alpha-tubulin suppressor-like RCC1 family protein